MDKELLYADMVGSFSCSGCLCRNCLNSEECFGSCFSGPPTCYTSFCEGFKKKEDEE